MQMPDWKVCSARWRSSTRNKTAMRAAANEARRIWKLLPRAENKLSSLVQMHAKHVLYIRTLLRTLQAGPKNTNPLIKALFTLRKELLRVNPGST